MMYNSNKGPPRPRPENLKKGENYGFITEKKTGLLHKIGFCEDKTTGISIGFYTHNEYSQ